jgi:hypothetical protein
MLAKGMLQLSTPAIAVKPAGQQQKHHERRKQIMIIAKIQEQVLKLVDEHFGKRQKTK